MSSTATYQMTFSYYWTNVNDGNSGNVYLQSYFGSATVMSIADESPQNIWQTASATALLEADYPSAYSVIFALTCPSSAGATSATMWIDSVSVDLLPTPTCPASGAQSTNILVNGVFECDNAASFPSDIPNWDLSVSEPSAFVRAINPGLDSAQAVALACTNNKMVDDSIAQLEQVVNVQWDGTYQMSF